MATFDLVHSRNYFKTRKTRIYAMAIVGICILLLGNRPGNGLLHAIGLFEAFGFFVGMVLVVSGIYLPLSYWYSRRTQHLGKIQFASDRLCISLPEKELDIPYDDMEFLVVTHNSYVGKDYEKSPLNNYTGDNWIEFSAADEVHKYEFKVDSMFKKNQLEEVVDRLRKSHPHFQYEQK